MTHVYLFRRLVFMQVLLGIVAFCLAEPGGNFGLLLIGGTLTALSWYVVEGPTGRPLPQPLINAAALMAVGYLAVDMYYFQRGQVIIAMGHFTMWLQILQLYGKKSNREYGLVLVLSLLQMVGASILSVSMLFGLLLGAYCLLGLATILVFQFKLTGDEVADTSRAGATRSLPPGEGAVSRGYRWQFRSLTLVIAAVCGICAAVVFLLLPRTSRLSESPLGATLSKAAVGFTNQIQLGGLPPGEGSREPVLHLTAPRRDSYLLRGAALDFYDPKTRTWTRGQGIRRTDVNRRPQPDARLANSNESDRLRTASVTFRSPRVQTLFTIHPTTTLEPNPPMPLLVNPFDQQTTLSNEFIGPVSYRFEFVETPGEAVDADPSLARFRPSSQPPFLIFRNLPEDYAQGWEVEPQLLREIAMSMIREQLRDPAIQRDPAVLHDQRDEQLARALEQYLATRFSYSLRVVPRGDIDPIVEFLTRNRQGHCEVFAAAMAAMTRSMGMRARVVTGYRAAEYNTTGDYFIVRQKHAHAWTEIDCGPKGWLTFDATPAASVDAEHGVSDSLAASLQRLYEHFEFLWVNTFVTYDKETREEIMGSVQSAAENRDTFLGKIVGWFKDLQQRWQQNQLNVVLMAVAVVFIAIGIVSFVRIIITRRRRLAALQLSKLDRQQRRELARSLAFYLQMLDLLERKGQRRPPAQTPMAFAQSLAQINAARFGAVTPLTELFYEIRFGYLPLNEDRQQRVRKHLKELEGALIG